MTEAQKLYEAALRKVRDNPALAPHEAFILADWPEGDGHLIWVIDANVEDILKWIAASSDEEVTS